MKIKKAVWSKITYFGVGIGVLLLIIGGIMVAQNWEFGIVKWEAIAQGYWLMIDTRAFYEQYTAKLITGFVLIACGITTMAVTTIVGNTIRNTADDKKTNVVTSMNLSITDELHKARILLDEGSITTEEYDALKRKLLSQ